MKQFKLILTMLAAAVLLPTGLLAQTTDVINSTFTKWKMTSDPSASFLGGLMETAEGNDWTLYIPTTGRTAELYTKSSSSSWGADESCIAFFNKELGLSGFEANIISAFDVKGPIYNVVVRVAGKVDDVDVSINDSANDFADPKRQGN